MASLFGKKTSASRPNASISSAIEQQMFNVLYFLQKDTSYHLLYFFATGIQFCHLLNNAFIETTFAWSHSVIYGSGFGRVLHYITLELFLVGEAAFYAMFFITAMVVLMLVGLTLFMSNALGSGNVPPQRLSRFVQFLVSVMIAFEGPISRILMAMIECDYGHTGENPYWHWQCFDSPGRVTLYILSMILLLVFIILISVFSFMHASSPKSADACTRAATWIDMTYSMFIISTVILFRLAWRSPVVLSLYFTAGGALMTVLVLMFQPFYRSSMNCFRVAIHAATAWTGACMLLISFIDNEESPIMSTVFLSGFPVVLWHGWKWSRDYLNQRVAEGTASELSDDQIIGTDAIIDRLRAPPQDIVSETWKDVHGASLVEQRTRFLQNEQSPELLEKADRILRAGLKSYPLSEYLLMRYVTFVIVYKNDVVLANLIVNQCLRSDFHDIESRLDIYRMHKDLQRARQVGSNSHRNSKGVDIISFEEAQKTLRTARSCHRQAHDQMIALMQEIARGKATAASVARRAESIYTNEEHAMECFELLLSQSEDSAEVYISFGNFLKDVMLDAQAAEVMFTMASGCRASGARDDGSDKGSSHHTNHSSKFSRMARLKEIVAARDQKLRRLSWKMRGITLLLVSIIVAVFCIYFFISNKFVESLLNLNEAGTRTTVALRTAYNVRTMHLGAVRNSSVRYNLGQTNIKNDLITARTMHHNLMYKYPTSYQRQLHFLNTPSVEQRMPSFTGYVNTSLSGDDAFVRFLQNAEIVSNSSIQTFLNIRANQSTSFVSFFYVMANWLNMQIALDSSTTMYQLEAEQYGFYAFLGIVLSSIFAALVEMAVVVFVFHPAVKQLFAQFQQSVLNIRLISMSQAKQALSVGLTVKTTEVNEEDNDDDDTPEESPTHVGRTLAALPSGKQAPSAKDKDCELTICIENPSSGPFAGAAAASATTPTAATNNGGLSPPVSPSERLNGGSGGRRAKRSSTMAHKRAPHHVRQRSKDKPTMHIRTPSSSEVAHNIALDALNAADDGIIVSLQQHKHSSGIVDEARPEASGARVDSEDDVARLSDDGEHKTQEISLEDLPAHVRDDEVVGVDGADAVSVQQSVSEPPLEEAQMEIPDTDDISAGEAEEETNRRASSTSWPWHRRRSSVGASTVQSLSKEHRRNEVASAETLASSKAGVPLLASSDPQQAQQQAQQQDKSDDDGDADFGSEKLETARKRRIRILYVLSLLLTVGALVGFCVYGALAVQRSVNVAVELNSVTRQENAMARLSILGREYALQNDPNVTLTAAAFPVFSEVDTLQSQIVNGSRGATMAHEAFISGYKEGWYDLPQVNGWPRMNAESPYQPFTHVPDLFYAGNRCKGGVKDRPEVADVLFEKNCLTYLSWRDSNDKTASNPRVQFFARTLDSNTSRCVYWNNSDPIVSSGWHTFFQETIRAYMRLADTPTNVISESHPAYLWIQKYRVLNPEFVSGTTKLILELQRGAMERIDNTIVTMVMFLSIVAVVVLVQYFVLGRQLGSILSQNLGMEGVVKRLVNHCNQFPDANAGSTTRYTFAHAVSPTETTRRLSLDKSKL